MHFFAFNFMILIKIKIFETDNVMQNASKFAIIGEVYIKKIHDCFKWYEGKIDWDFLIFQFGISKNIANFDHFIMHTKPQISVEQYFYENLSQPSIHTAHIPLWFFTTLFLYKIDTLDQNHGENSSQARALCSIFTFLLTFSRQIQ